MQPHATLSRACPGRSPLVWLSPLPPTTATSSSVPPGVAGAVHPICQLTAPALAARGIEWPTPSVNSRMPVPAVNVPA